MLIGLLSDTHAFLDEKIFTYFKDCDEVWHAGDIGDSAVVTRLKSFKPLKAVFGNIDDRDIQIQFPEDLRFECEGFDVCITHIGGSPPNYNPRIKKLLKVKAPEIFICGHSHILKIKRDIQFNNMLFINPGAAGNQGFHSVKTIVRLELSNHAVQKLEVIELGKRGALN